VSTTAPAIPLDAEVARKGWRALEPVHAMIYFVREAQEEYAALGYDVKGNPASGYFPSRVAAMGTVGPGVVQATFFNFSRLAVEFGMAGAWETASPADVLAARLRGADRALRRLCGDLLDDPSVEEAVALLRTATAACHAYGRPLYGAHADLPWPEQPHLALWHGITLLREYRGDGHVAALLVEGLSGLEAAVLHVGSGESWTRKPLQKTRGYGDEEWDAVVAELTARGWLQDDATLSEVGRVHRQRVEDATDRLALAPWEALGELGSARLRELVRPLSRAVVDGGGIGIR
jgi:hypothetical protein